MTALWQADREYLVKQQAVLAELLETIGKTKETILASQELIRQLDLMRDEPPPLGRRIAP
jgi:hypothetical protein